jgi:hypothetical protein
MVVLIDVCGKEFLLVGHQQKGVGMILMWGEILLMWDINDGHDLWGVKEILLVKNTNKGGILIDVCGKEFLLVGHQQKGVGMILMWGEILLMRAINDGHDLCGGKEILLVKNTNRGGVLINVCGKEFLLVGHQQKGVGMILMWGEILLMWAINDGHDLCGVKEICW